MPHFDTQATYDSGVRFDQPNAPRNTKKTMPKTRLELRSKADDALAAYCANHQAKMVGNPAFTAPVPTPAVFDAALADFQTRLAAYRAALDTASQLREEKDDARETLEALMTQRGGYVEITASDAAEILSAGIDLRAPSTPLGPLPAPQNVVASTGALEGEVDLTWRTVRGVASYIVETRPYNDPTAYWQLARIVPQATVTVGGLMSGKKHSFRVRAVGAAGDGAWSDETALMAP